MGGEVVIVDDDGDLLDALAEFIELSGGRRVWKARSVDELVSLGTRALACELAVLDVNLGRDKPSGVDALRWLSSRDFQGRVVFLTGHAPTFSPVEEAQTQAGIRLLSKPLNGDQLLALLEGGR
jgi:ActR/RegA family two-component response regulator